MRDIALDALIFKASFRRACTVWERETVSARGYGCSPNPFYGLPRASPHMHQAPTKPSAKEKAGGDDGARRDASHHGKSVHAAGLREANAAS
jgi:hypothetical protein